MVTPRSNDFKQPGGRGFVKALRDLTDRKAMEDRLHEQAEALREADRRKDEFLAVLSHELRNPLAPILNSVHVLHQHYPTDDPVILQARNTIERQVMHLKHLVDDLLDVSRVATGKIQLRTRPISLAEIGSSSGPRPSSNRRSRPSA